MKYLPEIFENNRKWAAARVAADPSFFKRLLEIQRPEYLWIGCSDSRVPANEIVGLDPGELFVHRNVANVVRRNDPNCMAVVQYAVEVLRVRHVIVTGHYGCGGIQAALQGNATGAVRDWLAPVRELAASRGEELPGEPDARWRRLCELNVVAQVHELAETGIVRGAWSAGQDLALHGWIYDLNYGLLRDLGATVKAPF